LHPLQGFLVNFLYTKMNLYREFVEKGCNPCNGCKMAYVDWLSGLK